MSISINEHIDDLKIKIDEIKGKQAEIAVRIEALKPLQTEFRDLDMRKDALERALVNLEQIREVAPEVEAALNPADPFGDAAG